MYLHLTTRLSRGEKFAKRTFHRSPGHLGQFFHSTSHSQRTYGARSTALPTLSVTLPLLMGAAVSTVNRQIRDDAGQSLIAPAPRPRLGRTSIVNAALLESRWQCSGGTQRVQIGTWSSHETGKADNQLEANCGKHSAHGIIAIF